MVLTRIARSWRQASGLVIVLSSHQPISMNSTSLLGSDILEITWNRLVGMSLKLPLFVLIFVHQFVPVLLRCSSLLLDFRLSFRIQIWRWSHIILSLIAVRTQNWTTAGCYTRVRILVLKVWVVLLLVRRLLLDHHQLVVLLEVGWLLASWASSRGSEAWTEANTLISTGWVLNGEALVDWDIDRLVLFFPLLPQLMNIFIEIFSRLSYFSHASFKRWLSHLLKARSSSWFLCCTLVERRLTPPCWVDSWIKLGFWLAGLSFIDDGLRMTSFHLAHFSVFRGHHIRLLNHIGFHPWSRNDWLSHNRLGRLHSSNRLRHTWRPRHWVSSNRLVKIIIPSWRSFKRIFELLPSSTTELPLVSIDLFRLRLPSLSWLLRLLRACSFSLSFLLGLDLLLLRRDQVLFILNH